MKYDGILFDLDGTLWNAAKPVWESWTIALKGAPDIERPPTMQELESVMGMTAEGLMRKLYPQLSRERGLDLFARCCEVENEHLRKNGGILYEGMEEMLSALSKEAPLFIVSNCNDGYISCFLEAHKMEKYFTDWECSGVTGLEKGDNIRLVVERNHLKAPVYVGDTVIDCNAAKQAGVPFLHAGYGFGTVPPGAVSAESPAKVLEYLQNS